MARTRKWGSEAERLAAYRSRQTVQPEAQSVRIDDAPVRIEAETVQQPVRIDGFVRFRHQPHVPFALFDGQGRGTLRTHTDGQQYVMVSRHAGSGLGELGVVTAHDWHARLGQRCEHGFTGWSCHTC